MVLILNDVAGSEIVLILVFVLIFFGSKSIPTLARTLGRITRQVKDATSDIQREIKKSSADMKNDLNLSALIKETQEDIQQPLDQMMNDIDDSIKYEPRRKDSNITIPSSPSEVEESQESITDNSKLPNEEVVDKEVPIVEQENNKNKDHTV
tara:strand:- start:223 stop:678 length:456 start_codon:yes stop_codon:yes gene_type:complete